MQRLTTLFRTLKFSTGVLLLFLCMHGVALAKPMETAAPEATKNLWILGYFVVGLCITLGMVVLSRSSRRSERAKPKEYEGLSVKE